MKSRTRFLVLLGTAAAAFSSLTDAAPQEPAAARARPPLVIQVGVELIQIDASVTDRKGRPIADLRAEDFTLEVDGKKRLLTNVSYFGSAEPGVRTGEEGAGTNAAPEDAGPGPSPGNTVVFVIDDLNMSFNSMYQARRGLTKFASEWQESRTRAAVRTTSDEAMTFTLFNNAPEFESAAAELRYNIRSDKGIASFRPTLSDRGATAGMAAVMEGNMSANPGLLHANLRQRFSSLITTINSLRSVPGRKAVVLVSEGFTVVPSGSAPVGFEGAFSSLFLGTSLIHEGVRLITEVANRASVVVYAVDPRGLIVDTPGAAHDPSPGQLERMVGNRMAERIVSQASLQQLADATGGLAIANRNDLKGGFGDVLKDQSAYYLIGFEPSRETFAKKSGRPRFHKIKLKVNRPDARVRTREGFYGITDQEVNEPAPAARP
jgi:VWFA-related protein